MFGICSLFNHKKKINSITIFPNKEVYITFFCKSCYTYTAVTYNKPKVLEKIFTKYFKINKETAHKLIENINYSQNWGRTYSFEFIQSFIEKGIPLGYWSLHSFKKN